MYSRRLFPDASTLLLAATLFHCANVATVIGETTTSSDMAENEVEIGSKGMEPSQGGCVENPAADIWCFDQVSQCNETEEICTERLAKKIAKCAETKGCNPIIFDQCLANADLGDCVQQLARLAKYVITLPKRVLNTILYLLAYYFW